MSCYGVLLDPGPGDTLRFLHGFCELLEERDERGVVFCTPMAYRNIQGLFSAVNREIAPVECSSFQKIREALKGLPETEIWYCYDIKYIDRITKCLPEEITEGTGHTFYMIDRFSNHKYMKGRIANHLKMLPPPKKKEKGLLFLRNMSVRPERNMNQLILKAIVDVSRERKLLYDVVGGEGVQEWEALVSPIMDGRLYVGGYPEYLVQLKEYGRYCFAIGMNSGGLDMAIAAGVMGIRIGEFHQHYSWLGTHYNDFLSNNCTINISSRSEIDVSNIGEREIRRAFDMVLDERKNEILWI